MTTSGTRLRRALAQARHVLESAPEPRRPGLGPSKSSITTTTRRAALVPGLPPTLVHPHGRRGLSDLVDSSTLETIESLLAVGRELQRCGLEEVVRNIRADGAKRRARLLGGE